MRLRIFIIYGGVNILKDNERIDDLEFENLKIIQNKSWFCFGVDAVLLSDFAKDIKPNSNIIDLCSGSGIISILLSKKTKPKSITAIEIQKDVAEMSERSIKLNNLQDIIKVYNTDLNNLENLLHNNSFDSIVTNPPYKEINSGIQNESLNKLISRHEIKCNLDDILRVSSNLLKNNGSFYMVHRPNRLCDIICTMRKYNLEPKLIKFVQPNIKKSPNLVLIKGVKNAKTFLKFENNLILYNLDGSYTNEVLKIYNK